MTKTIKGRPDMIANDAELTWQYIADSYDLQPKQANDCMIYARLRNIKTVSDFEVCGMFVEWSESVNKKNDTVQEPDLVNHPPHYKAGSVECIEAIRAALTDEEFRGYCKGTILSYTWREKHKGGLEDLKKAQWYLNRLIQTK